MAAEAVQTKVLDNTKVSFSVIPMAREDGPKSHPGTERWEGAHRLVVELADRATGRPITDAEVQANIAEKDFAGKEQRLERTISAGKVTYETRVDLPRRRATYRVLVHFREPGSARTREAEFEYTHHH